MVPLLTFYGDDFTGSSAVMEILAFAGVPTVMFLDVPSLEILAKLEGVKAIGIAGIARSKSLEWMDRELPKFFNALMSFEAPVLHYKTCSTFDSAPNLGSIGRATEIGLLATKASWAPLVVGAPAIGRYQVFGTLFAAHDGEAYRLDRHPVMARHPATPMQEADLCRHLDAQTNLKKAVIDWRVLQSGSADKAIRSVVADGARIVALDVFDEPTLAAIGKIIWEKSHEGIAFAVGSQGVEYALVAHWREIGILPKALPFPDIFPAKPLLVVSGSCSEVTARQISVAENNGFNIISIDATKALDQETWLKERLRVQAIALSSLAVGSNTLVCTARGPDDQAIANFNTAVSKHQNNIQEIHARIGNGLGLIVKNARESLGISRVVFSGGDTSGHAMLAIDAHALMPVASLANGVPLLRVLSTNQIFDGMEVALKGGQMGDKELFIRAARGQMRDSF